MGIESGMVRNIAIDPRGSTDQTIYIATDNGGIWKTTDGGTTWSPKTDSMPSLNMGAVALDPGNPSIVYAGTGNERSANNRRNGVGIYKSTDGGDNWQPTILGAIPGGGNIFSGRAINRIVLPAPNLLLVATDIGVYISFNGGASFFPSPTIGGDVTDLDVDTATPTTVYASIAGFGIFKSTDSGASFPTSPAIGNGPGNIFTVSNGGPSNFGFIAFTQSTLPNNQTMYVNVQLNSGPVQAGMFRSVTGGASWSQISVLNNDIEFAGAEGGYAQVVGVDPQDANRVYIGVRQLLMATDGGAAGLTEANRIDLNKVHVDQHALVFTPPSHVPGGSYQLGRVKTVRPASVRV